MASGTYAKKSSPQQPMEVSARIPSRATRQLNPAEVLEANTESEPDTLNVPVAKKTQPVRPAAPQKAPPRQVKVNNIIDEYQPHVLEKHRPWLVPLTICTVGAVCFLLVLLSASIFQRPSGAVLNYTGGKTYDVQVGGKLASSWQVSQPLPASGIPASTGPYSVIGTPTVTIDIINKVLDQYHSPAAGKGQALHEMGVKYGIDPVFALAFFQHESTFGTQGEAKISLSLGNLRCIPNAECKDNYAWFPTWEAGFEAWYQLIRNLYIAQWKLTTIEQIIPKYAPAADNNNEQAYINSLKHSIDTWHSGSIVVQ